MTNCWGLALPKKGNVKIIACDPAVFKGTQDGQAIQNAQSGGAEHASLTLGSSGERVAGVQHSLIELGYLKPTVCFLLISIK